MAYMDEYQGFVPIVGGSRNYISSIGGINPTSFEGINSTSFEGINPSFIPIVGGRRRNTPVVDGNQGFVPPQIDAPGEETAPPYGTDFSGFLNTSFVTPDVTPTNVTTPMDVSPTVADGDPDGAGT